MKEVYLLTNAFDSDSDVLGIYSSKLNAYEQIIELFCENECAEKDTLTYDNEYLGEYSVTNDFRLYKIELDNNKVCFDFDNSGTKFSVRLSTYQDMKSDILEMRRDSKIKTIIDE